MFMHVLLVPSMFMGYWVLYGHEVLVTLIHLGYQQQPVERACSICGIPKLASPLTRIQF
jgi:hypothetical protein